MRKKNGKIDGQFSRKKYLPHKNNNGKDGAGRKTAGLFFRKGMITSFAVVLFALIGVIAVLSTFAIKVLLLLQGADSRSTKNFEVVLLAGNPFSIAHTIMTMKPDERTVAEIALQTAITEKISADDKGALDSVITPFLDGLQLKYWNVKIVKGSNVLYDLDISGRRCGAHDQGFCSAGFPRNDPTPNTPCGIGRVNIDSDGKCPRFFGAIYCCAEDYKPGTQTYNDPPAGNIPVLRCGTNDQGICDAGCTEGRTQIAERVDECKDRRSRIPQLRKEVICCAPVDKVGIVELGSLVSAEVPLLYKTKQGFPTFYCVDRQREAQCTGELARGFCGEEKQCCITQLVSCKTATSASGFCLDIRRCSEIGARSEPSPDCPASGTGTYQCCVTGDLSKVKSSAPIAPTGEECNFGAKMSGDVGEIVITVGEGK